MRKILLFVLLLVVSGVTAQDYKALRTINNDVVYSDAEGNWYPESAWIAKYGRKQFKEAFPERNKYHHVQTADYIRWDYRDAFTAGLDMRWSRVFESELDTNSLKDAAVILLEDAQVDGDKVIGSISSAPFEDYQFGMWSLGNYIWSAKVTYEFRDNRYKVTLSSIRVQCTVSVSAYGGGLGFHSESVWEPLREILYNGEYKRIQYEPFINSIDHTFCKILYLRVNEDSDDW